MTRSLIASMKNLLRAVFLLHAAVGWLAAVARADTPAEIQKRGVLRVGVSEFAPWTFVNRGGELEGFEIDNGRELASDLGVKVEFKVYNLDELLAAVDRGEIDVVAAGLAITPARALKVEFSNAYFESGTAYVTHRALAPDVRLPSDLNKKGFVVAVVADTFSVGLAAQLYDVAEVKTFPDSVSAEKQLLAGRVQGYFTSLPEAEILITRHGDILDFPTPRPLVGSVSGFAVKRGNQALLNFLNAWIAAHLADRLLPTTYKHWFGNFDWIRHVKK
jgi:polar amino acid transport system substrate-binding protein